MHSAERLAADVGAGVLAEVGHGEACNEELLFVEKGEKPKPQLKSIPLSSRRAWPELHERR